MNLMSFQFMLRQEVLKLYREVLRTARKVEPSQKSDIIYWARGDIEMNKMQTDEVGSFVL